VAWQVSFEVVDLNAPPPTPAAESPKPGGKDKGKKGKEEAAPVPVPKELTFTVTPKTWDIPPHEYRYVNICFNPKEVTSYRAGFVAKATDAVDPTREMAFSLTGAGTLPCVTIVNPKGRTPAGALVVDFGTVQLRRSRKVALVLQNDGVVPATCLFEGQALPELVFGSLNGSVTLQPGETRSLDMVFRPTKAGPMAHSLRMTTMHNAFEVTTLSLTGSGFERDVLFEGLPSGDGPESVTFPELNLDDATEAAEGTQVTFSLSNPSASPIKFKWAAHPSVTFTPARGHLAPGASKDVVARYKCANPEKLESAAISLSTQRIRYTQLPGGEGEALPDWDESMRIIRPGTEEEIARIKNPPPPPEPEKKPSPKGKAKEPEKPPEPEPPQMWLGPVSDTGVQMIVQVQPEPAHEGQGAAQDQPLLVSAVADRPRYECPVRSLVFKPTAMFQARVSTFTITNVSNTQLPFSFTLEEARSPNVPRPPGDPIPNPFSVTPAAGSIGPKKTETFTVRFLPLEVDQFQYALQCTMPSLAPSSEPLVVVLKGSAFRPACHFEVAEDSGYLTRRPANLRNENGQLGPIEASTLRVVEVKSIGVTTRNERRFLVMNPTSTSYEFVWEAQGVPSPAWRCLTPKGTILAGKRGEMIFEYTPEEVGVAETFFRFRVLGQRDEELFLFVGSVVEPKVALDRVRVDLNASIVGTAATETFHIVNNEDTPFSFSFDRKFLSQAGAGAGAGRRPVLEVSPVAGLIPARGRCPVTVTLCPDEEKAYNFNIAVTVRRKPAKLNLNLKGEGYLIHSKVLVAKASEKGGEAGDAEARELMMKPAGNVIDFGAVHLNEKAVKTLTVVNTGKFNFDYSLHNNAKHNPMLSISGGKLSGTVRKGERVDFRMEFYPVKETSLEGCSVRMVVAGKCEYEVRTSRQSPTRVTVSDVTSCSSCVGRRGLPAWA
jgi:hydrocephalus-inducing protein